MKYRKILVPVDGSEHSRHALDHALGLAQCQGAQMVLLHCYEPIPMLIGGEGRIELAGELREESTKLMEPFATSLREAGLTPILIIREGRPGDVIVEEARETGCDLIVMGSRGRSELEGILLGNVAHSVLADAHCPVLITR